MPTATTPTARQTTQTEARAGDPAPADFDAALALDPDDPTHAPEAVVVHKRTTLERSGYSLNARVTSALVSRTHAADLQQALAAAQDPMDWKLPEEGEESFEVDAGDFQLRGWICDPEDYREGLDQHDPYASGMTGAVPLPGFEFRQATGTDVSDDGKRLVITDNTVVATTTRWADREEGSRETNYSSTSSGEIVHVDRSVLSTYLRDADKALILEVQVDRHRSDGDTGYQPPVNRIYILKPDGSINGS